MASHTAITLAGLRLANLTGRRDRILEKLAIRRDVVAITQKQFDAQPAVLDALREELIALYRTSFIAALANPSMTGHLATPTTAPVQRPQGGVTP